MRVLVIESAVSPGNRAFESILADGEIEVTRTPSLPRDIRRYGVVVFNGVDVSAMLDNGRDQELVEDVHSGKGCVAIHDSVSPLTSHPSLLGLMGLQLALEGVSFDRRQDGATLFTLHLAIAQERDPIGGFPIHPSRSRPRHPIVSGVRPFDISDEFWAMNTTADVTPLLYAHVADRLRVVPRLKEPTCVAGCRNVARGRCAFVIFGHYPATYENPYVRTALKQAVLWAGRSVNASPYSYDIFISYSSKDQKKADQFLAQAKKEGLRCYLAPRELKGGDVWSERIRKALVSSRELCVLVSRETLESEWVTTEWGAAWALHRRLTPILLGVRPEKLPDRLRQRQAIEFAQLDEYLQQASRRARRDER